MSEKNLLYKILIITVLITALIGYFGAYKFIKSINASKVSIKTKQAELNALQDKELDLEKLNKSYKNYQDKIDIIATMLPKNKGVSDYITQIENASILSGVAIKSIKIPIQPSAKETKDELSQLVKNGDIYELPVDVIINSSNFNTIYSFVSTVENLSRFTTIKKINLKKDESNIIEASISINIYVLP